MKFKTSISADQFRRQHVDQVEHDLQRRFTNWFRLQYRSLLLVGFPNAARRTKAERGRLLAEGMTAGFPDQMVAYPSGEFHGLFIEWKTVRGKPSDEQLTIHAYLRSVGYEVIMPTSFEEGQRLVNGYLNL